jgi:hypothetical protein
LACSVGCSTTVSMPLGLRVSCSGPVNTCLLNGYWMRPTIYLVCVLRRRCVCRAARSSQGKKARQSRPTNGFRSARTKHCTRLTAMSSHNAPRARTGLRAMASLEVRGQENPPGVARSCATDACPCFFDTLMHCHWLTQGPWQDARLRPLSAP